MAISFKSRNINFNNKSYRRLKDLCNELNLNKEYMHYYFVDRDLSIEDAIEKTKIRSEMNLNVNGIEFKSYRDVLNHYNLNPKPVNQLLDAGVPLEQCVNIVRENNKIHYDGEVYANLRELSKARNCDYELILGRVSAGWSVSRAVTEPKKGSKKVAKR